MDKPSDLTTPQIEMVVEHLEEQEAAGCHIDQLRLYLLRLELASRGSSV